MELKRTPLYESHVRHGGKIVPFAGWELPVQFSGVIEEHRAVRTGAGLFDVSHMGEITIKGSQCIKTLQYFTCNDVSKLVDGAAQYSAILNESGGVIDDIIIYRRNERDFLLCVNASNAEKDFDWLKTHNTFDVEIENVSSAYGQIAFQGPKVVSLAKNLFPLPAKPFQFVESEIDGVPVIVARTGYTGEDGVELFTPWNKTEIIWEKLAAIPGVTLCGLGSRDTLRLEACYPLHGHELSEEIPATESGLSWIVKFDKGEFIGRNTLETNKKNPTRKLCGIFVKDSGIIRQNDKVFSSDGEEIGLVTSGTRTPTLDRALGLVLIKRGFDEVGASVFVEVRGRRLSCEVVKIPFYKRSN